MEILFLEDVVKNGISRNFIFKKIAELEKEFFPKYPYNIKDIKKFHKLSNGYTLIAFDKDNVIGYLIPLLFKSKDYLQILTIAVDKKHHRKGYGTKLIKKCEKITKNFGLNRIIILAEILYQILKTLKKLGYRPMQTEDINKFTKEGIFGSSDDIKKEIFQSKISALFPTAHVITKDIGKKNHYSFIPMIKNIK